MRRAALAVGLLAIGFVPLLLGALFVHYRGGGSDAALFGRSAYRGGPVPGNTRLPDFRLRSYRGTYVRTRDFRGKVVVVTFLETRCTTSCPIIATVLGDAIRVLPAKARANVRLTEAVHDR